VGVSVGFTVTLPGFLVLVSAMLHYSLFNLAVPNAKTFTFRPVLLLKIFKF